MLRSARIEDATYHVQIAKQRGPVSTASDMCMRRLVTLEVGLSAIAVRCPTCGSSDVSTAGPDEYTCGHCNTRFQIARPSATLVRDTKVHNCPICGRPVSTSGSFMCTECRRLDLCDRCVTSVPMHGGERYVCKTCVTTKGWGCGECGDYAPNVCYNCKRRACRTHLGKYFGVYLSGYMYQVSCPCAGADSAIPAQRLRQGSSLPKSTVRNAAAP